MSGPDVSPSRRRLWIVAGAILVAFALCWLLESSASPLRDYLLRHPALRDVWTAINAPAALLGFAFSETVHRPSLVGYLLGIAIQWGLLGGVLSLVLIRAPRVEGQRGPGG